MTEQAKKNYHEAITDAWNVLKQGLVDKPDFDKITAEASRVYAKHDRTDVSGFTKRIMFVILEEINRIDQGELE